MELSKIFLIIFFFTLSSVSKAQADEFKWGELFKEGDVVSAETFNQIFNSIQNIQRSPTDSDLIGKWSCISTTNNNTNLSSRSNCTLKGSIYECTNQEITFTASSGSTSLELAYSISTSAPDPLRVLNTTNAFTGTYQLYDGRLYLNDGSINAASIYDLKWRDKDTLNFQGLTGNLFTNIDCDKSSPLPLSPTEAKTSITGTSVSISWSDQSDNETGVKIYRRLSSEDSSSELVTAIASSPYVDNTLTNGQKAYYSVVAYNDNGESEKSKVVKAEISAD